MQTQGNDTLRGTGLAVAAYGIWGIFPLYMKLLSHVPAVEIVAHRIVWALPFAALLLWWQGATDRLWPVLRSPRALGMAAVTATLISVNWGVYVYAIVSNQALDAALGYYINPLVNVMLGAIFLKERPTRLQGFAIALAALAVLVLATNAGGLPWISLVLALSFATYGLLRKTVPVGATEGFMLEVLLLVGPSLAWLVWLAAHGESHFLADGETALLLIVSGPITAVPLILFAAAARLLSFSTIGLLQYMVPTLLFLFAVFLFGEPFSAWQLVAFALIWTALAIYSVSLFRTAGERKRAATAVAAESEGTVIEDVDANGRRA
ncbi:EamA family transporter RarD [Mangrovicella endophytica]|uniref:EamA family transporter RarD n=1 Tax=Mangrovicella endophytica TaxID=2066697 RepID=UPI000C9E3903|nr:EamA family transporter RarD [Mangrovicella endophytica]